MYIALTANERHIHLFSIRIFSLLKIALKIPQTYKNEITIISGMTRRKTANQQRKNMYVKLQKYLKEVMHLFLFTFFIFKAQFMKINEAKTSVLCLAYICDKNLH